MSSIELHGGGECELSGNRTIVLPPSIVMLTHDEIVDSSELGCAIAAGVYGDEIVWLSRSGELFTLGPIGNEATLSSDGYTLVTDVRSIDLRYVERRPII